MSSSGGDHLKKVRLLSKLAKAIHSRGWWTFEPEGSVEGFKGTGPIMIVADQPSTSAWPPGHPNKVLFYSTLTLLNTGGAHLTDVIKRRGKASASARQLPPDFDRHVDILHREFRIISPTRILALGELAERWLRLRLPQYANRVCGIIHFAAKPNNRTPGVATEFRRQMRAAIESPESELRYVRARPHVKYSIAAAPKTTMRGQRLVIYELVKSNTTGIGELSEPQAMKLVYAAATRGELRTKQCPWRIWTYYCPQLVRSGLFRELNEQDTA